MYKAQALTGTPRRLRYLRALDRTDARSHVHRGERVCTGEFDRGVGDRRGGW